MANKRIKKKQQTKKTSSLLEYLGYGKKEKRVLKNKHTYVEKEYKKKRKTESRNARWKHQSDLLESLGFKRSSPQRTWGEKRFNEWYEKEIKKKRKREKIKEDENALYLLIFWRDKTAEGYADAETIERYKFQYSHMSNDMLLENINKYLRTPKPSGAEIGTSATMIIRGNQRKQYINFMSHFSQSTNMLADINDWIVVYEGKVQRYHPLLVSIHAMIRLMYDSSERAEFIGDLIHKYLPRINKSMAKRLAKDLKWRNLPDEEEE